jgi:hypothetical protein
VLSVQHHKNTRREEGVRRRRRPILSSEGVWYRAAHNVSQALLIMRHFRGFGNTVSTIVIL